MRIMLQEFIRIEFMWSMFERPGTLGWISRSLFKLRVHAPNLELFFFFKYLKLFSLLGDTTAEEPRAYGLRRLGCDDLRRGLLSAKILA